MRRNVKRRRRETIGDRGRGKEERRTRTDKIKRRKRRKRTMYLIKRG